MKRFASLILLLGLSLALFARQSSVPPKPSQDPRPDLVPPSAQVSPEPLPNFCTPPMKFWGR